MRQDTTSGFWRTQKPDVVSCLIFVTSNAARALRLKDYGLEPGCKADLNALAAPTIREVLRLQQPPSWVICNGKVFACNQVQRDAQGVNNSGMCHACMVK
jgi:cytosine deaminase